MSSVYDISVQSLSWVWGWD